MPEGIAEVGVSLVVDDQSTATLQKVQEGLHQTGEEAKVTSGLLTSIDANLAALVQHTQHAAKGSGDIAHEVAKGNVEFELMKGSVELVGEAIKVAWEFTEKLTDAAIESAEAAEKQEKDMAGFLFLMDQGKHSMAELRDYTSMQREEFEQFSVTAGVAVKDLVGSYDKLIERGSMSSEKAKELTEQMAIVGRVVPGGMQSLAQGMSGVEMGMVRARNPIVQLIAATHTLQGNAKDVAKQMQHMAPEAQMKLAEDAIARQAEQLKKMGAVTPDLGHLKESFEGVKEGFLESMGKPMLEALVPQLVKLRDFLALHMEEIKRFGEKIGAAAGQAIEYVGSVLQGIWQGLSYNWDEFKTTFHEIFGDWEAAWGTSRETTADIKQEFFAVGTTLKDIFLDISKTVKAMVEVAMDASDVLHGRAVGTSQLQVTGAGLTAAAADPMLAPKAFEAAIDRFRAKAEGVMDPANIEADVLKMRQTHEGYQAAGEEDKSAVVSQNWDKVNEALEGSIQHHQDSLTDYQIKLLAGSDAAAMAIHTGQIHIAGGMDELMKMIGEKSPELAAKLRDMGNVVKNQGGIKPSSPVQNFYGGVHVKQDFKDQEPDAIMLTFKKGLASAASNRTSSRTGSAFGW